jgi:hypothetical protein
VVSPILNQNSRYLVWSEIGNRLDSQAAQVAYLCFSRKTFAFIIWIKSFNARVFAPVSSGQWKCNFDEMQCPSGRCIPLIWKCDGKAHCEDHVDETNCQGAFFSPHLLTYFFVTRSTCS